MLINTSPQTFLVLAKGNASIVKKKIEDASEAVKNNKNYQTLDRLATAKEEYVTAVNNVYLNTVKVFEDAVMSKSSSVHDKLNDVSEATGVISDAKEAAIAARNEANAYKAAM
jgi:hypothetical protein